MVGVPEGIEYESTGRQIYEALRPATKDMRQQPTLYLYHVVVNAHEGLARWVIGAELGSKTHAVAYIDSWAVTPYTAALLNDNPDTPDTLWQIQGPRVGDMVDEPGFVHNADIRVECSGASKDKDNTIYFDASEQFQVGLSGFYVETAMTPRDIHGGAGGGVKSIYAQIRANEEDRRLYMYKLNSATWMIGEVPNVDNGLAYHDEATSAATPGQLDNLHHRWRFVSQDPQDGSVWNWSTAHSVVVSCTMKYQVDASGNEMDLADDASGQGKVGAADAVAVRNFPDIYAALRYYRSVKYIPSGQQYITMRNAMPIPTLGFGTGGLHNGDLKKLVKYAAVEAGYRTFDLAREYGNERLFADAIEEIAAAVAAGKTSPSSELSGRHNLFIISKVWPTELGVVPTRDAVRFSLHELKSNYIDMYLLHWPRCDASIDWMRCQDTIEPESTWKQSWRALEREVSEGRLLGIGVSNFDVNLLTELGQHARIAPQLIQNHAELGPGNTDNDVRVWARKRGVVYMPYAHQRNLQSYTLAAHDMRELGWDDHHINRRSQSKDEL
jgi:diketogulonate reductase-like aldo/keto reductase